VTTIKNFFNKYKYYLILHLVILQGSFGGIASKTAAGHPMFSRNWFLFYGILLINLFLYAAFWQQIIKKFSLTTAFLNKSVIIIWAALWGFLLFKEPITLNMIAGGVIVIIGAVMVVIENE
jgi:drug/metabolite transporter (DMT)-like permease